MDRNQLFVETVTDLAQRVAYGQREYPLLMAAALLRKLLLDEQPLIHLVNRHYRMDIQFEVKDARPSLPRPEGELHYFWGNNLDPIGPSGGVPTRLVSQEQLIKLPVLYIGGKLICFRDLVSEAAHVLGAVHAGRDSDLSEPLRSMDSSLKLSGHVPAIGLLRGLGSVVERGCRVLVERIQADLHS